MLIFQCHHSLKAQMILESYTLDCYTPQKIIKCILFEEKILTSSSTVSSIHTLGQQVSLKILSRSARASRSWIRYIITKSLLINDTWNGDLDKMEITEKHSQVEILRKRVY